MGGFGFFLIIIAFFFLYFVLVRPQKRRQLQQQQMLDDLRLGDEVLTVGGIYGTVSQVEDDQVTVEIAPQTEVRVARRAIAGVTREPEEEAEETEVAEEPGEAEDSHADEGSGAVASNEENRG